MHTECVTYNKQRYFKLLSDFLDSTVSLAQPELTHIKREIVMPVKTIIMHMTFDPGTCVHLASHAVTC